MKPVAAFRDVRARVATAVSVVTTADSRGKPRGVTVGTLCSLSLDPPLVMFCLDRSGGSHELMTTASRTLIHVLRDDQAEVAARFSQRGTDRFTGRSGDWHGLPTIADTLIRLACARYANVPAGDHTIVMCLVTDAEIGAGKPLLSYDRAYSSPLPLLCGGRSLPGPVYLIVMLGLPRVARCHSLGKRTRYERVSNRAGSRARPHFRIRHSRPAAGVPRHTGCRHQRQRQPAREPLSRARRR
jgi:flavin reductase ActVB